ncbi:EamA family transporter [Oceanicella actignis]|uniref:EamA-like transporter family protein n=1 Tax=Oceanicella actignis TaxID=1189325 RepID=A0A1M7S2F4_9RHOB|nr:EamA family transporter [Oceanicella actignis]TYO90172.1 EamA-like transporter family protein [Oceanicella actignis]SES90449.1 EamA-like transporter family protein [Oceanicella actignis]SHN52640.1 EamA-like transporter family protein [Oceanicella actignis]
MPAEWIRAIEGTEAGAQAALGLALLSALAHAAFGALQKGRHDPWLTRGAIDLCYMLMALPAALWLVPRPTPGLWAALGGAWLIHTVYKLFQAMAYARGAYTVVYPVARGVGPLATAALAGVVFHESLRPGQWAGAAVLSGAIMALAALNLRRADAAARASMAPALALAALTGLMIAAYTTYDAWGVRLAEDPFTFLAWFFVIDGWAFPALALWRMRRGAWPPPAPGQLALRALAGAAIAYVSFGAVMLATRLDKVGEAAALRETSTLFAALIGWLFLGERVGPARAGLMALIALGAAMVEFG